MGEAKRRRQLDPNYGKPVAVPKLISVKDLGTSELSKFFKDPEFRDNLTHTVFPIEIALLREDRVVKAICWPIPNGYRKISTQFMIDPAEECLPYLGNVTRLCTEIAKVLLESGKKLELSNRLPC